MLKLKKAILALVSLFALVLSLDVFTGDAKTGMPEPAAAQSKTAAKLPGLPPKQGVNYAKFDHTTHSLSCDECHDVDEAERVTKYPVHAACEECHSIPMFTLKQDFCIIC